MKEYNDLIEQVEYKISTKQCNSNKVKELLEKFKQNQTQELYIELRDKYYSSIYQCSFPVIENSGK